jgi:hypothetical protein
MKKLTFHILNVIFICLYIYPGSVFGFLFYGNSNKQPQITSDFIVSSNHVYAFMILSIFGFINYYKTNKALIVSYLLSASIFLEVFHFKIPNRSFQFSDLFGNIVGVLLAILIIYLLNYWRKN